MIYQIHDKANGILQWEGEAASPSIAWEIFRTDLGYDTDIPGVCEQDAYIICEIAN